MDEAMSGKWVYGADHDDPHPGPEPGHSYVELVAGPLDGLLLDVTGWTGEQRYAIGVPCDGAPRSWAGITGPVA